MLKANAWPKNEPLPTGLCYKCSFRLVGLSAGRAPVGNQEVHHVEAEGTQLRRGDVHVDLHRHQTMHFQLTLANTGA